MLIIFCILLLLAYLFDLTSSRTKIPSVILLLLLGWGVRKILELFDVDITGLTTLLPVFGTVGLIMIVLEGALELELNRSKFALIKSSFLMTLLGTLVLSISLALIFQYYNELSFRQNLLNAIPFSVISSAIAIPSTRSLPLNTRELVIYESSLSDIIGVLLFNFLINNGSITILSISQFTIDIVIITAVSCAASIALAIFLKKIDHSIKFVPILLFVILIYEVSQIYHLPALIFILLFGLFIGNVNELRRIRWLRKFRPGNLDNEVIKLKEFLTEATFLIRALFFLIFGSSIKRTQLLNIETFSWALTIVSCIFILRIIQLRIAKLPLLPLLFIAPRGLITILLFLGIGVSQSIPIVSESLIIQVIVLSALIMMVGLFIDKKDSRITWDYGM